MITRVTDPEFSADPSLVVQPDRAAASGIFPLDGNDITRRRAKRRDERILPLRYSGKIDIQMRSGFGDRNRAVQGYEFQKDDIPGPVSHALRRAAKAPASELLESAVDSIGQTHALQP